MDGMAPSAPQYSGPTTTANSATEGRLKVDTGGVRKRKIMKKVVKDVATKSYNSDLSQLTRVVPENRSLYKGSPQKRQAEIMGSNKRIPLLSKPGTAPFKPGDKFKNPNK